MSSIRGSGDGPLGGPIGLVCPSSSGAGSGSGSILTTSSDIIFGGGFIGDVLGGCMLFCCIFAAAWAACARNASRELLPIGGGPKHSISLLARESILTKPSNYLAVVDGGPYWAAVSSNDADLFADLAAFHANGCVLTTDCPAIICHGDVCGDGCADDCSTTMTMNDLCWS